MTDEVQNETVPVKTYRPWVAVVLSLFVSGASQFFMGQKLAGVMWFLVTLFSGLSAVWCLASPLVPGDLPGLIAWIISISLWILMLVKSYKPIPRLKVSAWCGYILIAIFIHVFLIDGIHLFFRPFNMPTGSMSPTIHGQSRRSDGTTNSGDHFIVQSYAYWLAKPSRGDVIAFKTKGISPSLPDNQIYLKRVIGVPGDVLSIRDGHLFNDDQRITKPSFLANLVVISPPISPQYLATSNDKFKVPDGQYFVIGDNTGNSFDSRFWGTVPRTNIVGKVSKIYWPLNHAGNVE